MIVVVVTVTDTQFIWWCALSGSLSNPKREKHAGQRVLMGTETCIGNGTALCAMLREACACKRDAPMSVSIRLWPLRRDDRSRVLIGAAGTWRSDWRRRDVGVLIDQSACRLLAFARETIDSTQAAICTRLLHVHNFWAS